MTTCRSFAVAGLAVAVLAVVANAQSPKVVAPADPARALAAEIAQRKDPDRRAEALGQIRAMLDDAEPRTRIVAMRALQQVAEVKFDRDAFGEALRRSMRHENEEVRALAVTILPSYGGGPRDLTAIVALAEDPAPRVRQAVPAAFVAANERQGGATFDALLLKLLADSETNVRRDALRSTNNIDVGADVEARIIELTHDEKLGRDAIYNGLASRPTLSVPVVERLLELFDDPDANVVSRCASALNRDVPPMLRDRVDAALWRVFDDSIDTNARVNCVHALGRSTDPAVRDRMMDIALDEGEVERVRDAARRYANSG